MTLGESPAPKDLINSRRRLDFIVFLQALEAVEDSHTITAQVKREWSYFLIDEWLAYAYAAGRFDQGKGFLPNDIPPLMDTVAGSPIARRGLVRRDQRPDLIFYLWRVYYRIYIPGDPLLTSDERLIIGRHYMKAQGLCWTRIQRWLPSIYRH